MAATDGENQTEERKFRRRYLHSQWAVVFVSIGVAIIAAANLVVIHLTYEQTIKAIREAKRANDISLQNLREQTRPYVGVGRPDGKLAKFRVKGEAVEVVVYFSNAGINPALSFTTNIYSVFPTGPIQTVPNAHIGRFLDLDPRHYPFAYKPGGAGIISINRGPNLPGHAVRAVVVRQESVPNSEQLRKIKDGKLFFWLTGTFEYCDESGAIHCEGFTLKYEPEPVDDFIGLISEDCSIPPERVEDVMRPPDNR